jgi:CRP-like cAMP-binding protein
MPAITIVSLSAVLKSQILDGFTPSEGKIILSAATHRRFAADSVITNQGCLADHLFLLTKGRARHFFVTVAGKKLLLQWLGPEDLIGSRTVLSNVLRISSARKW